jgi:hypothetical protein
MSSKGTKLDSRQAVRTKPTPADHADPVSDCEPDRDLGFLVIIFDQSFKKLIPRAVRAADEAAAGQKALARVIEDNDGDDPGYVVMAAWSRKHLVSLLEQMDASA